MNTPHLNNKQQQYDNRHKRLLGEILATVHGDGGHYQAEHGDIKATIDAIHIINNCIKEIDNLKYELKTLKSRIDDNSSLPEEIK